MSLAQRYLKPRPVAGSLALLLLLALLAFLTLYPIGLAFVKGFQVARPGEAAVWSLRGWQEAFGDPAIPKALGSGILLSIVRTAIAALFGLFLAWAITRTDMTFKGLVEALLWVGLFLPVTPLVLGWVLLLDPHYGRLNELLRDSPSPWVFSIYSYGGILLASLVFYVSLFALVAIPAFRALGARDRAMPTLAPALLVGGTLSFLKGLGSLDPELILGFPVGIRVASTKFWELVHWEPPRYQIAMPMMVVLLVVSLALLFVMWALAGRRYIGILSQGLSQPARPVGLGRWRYGALALCLLFFAVTILLPLSFLLVGSFQKLYGFFNIPDPWTARHWGDTFGDPVFLRSLRNTLLVGLVAGLGGALFYALVGYAMARMNLRARGAMETLSWLPWALPGVLFSLAFLWWFLQTFGVDSPLYGTIWLLMIALVIKGLPVGSLAMRASIEGREGEPRARPWGLLPPLMPLVAAAGLFFFLFISAVQERGSLVLLATFKSRSLSLLGIDYIAGAERENAAVVGAFVVLLVLFLLALAYLTMRLLGAWAARRRPGPEGPTTG